MFAIVLTCLLEAAIGAFFWEALYVLYTESIEDRFADGHEDVLVLGSFIHVFIRFLFYSILFFVHTSAASPLL